MPGTILHTPIATHCRRARPRYRHWALSCLFLAIWLVGCSSNPYATSAPVTSTAEKAQRIPPVVGTALAQLDRPYRYGGHSPRGFDCSGLIYYAHLRSGIPIPRTASEQRQQARPVPLAELSPGDLLFFHQGKRKASHVGLYVGDGRFIHASAGEHAVTLSRLTNPYWQAHLIGAGRYD